MPLRGPGSWSRETRLLWLTIAVSVGVLFVLARFRFPAETTVVPTPQPLERLAARATYDELAADVARLHRQFAASLIVLRGHATNGAAPATLRQLLDRGTIARGPAVFIPALRIREDTAVALLDGDVAIEGVVGEADAVPLVLAFDQLRGIAVVRVPAPPATAAWQLPSLAALSTPRYVVVAEGARGGAALRPVFLGQADRVEEPRWAAPVLVVGGMPVAEEGAFVFSLAGEAVGLAVTDGDAQAIVPADTVAAVANALLANGSPPLTDFGVSLRTLTAADVKATGATAGLFVDAVEPKTLAAGHLRAGDLLVALDGRPAVDVESVLVRLSQLRAGAVARFQVRRERALVDVDIAVPGGAAAGPGAAR